MDIYFTRKIVQNLIKIGTCNMRENGRKNNTIKKQACIARGKQVCGRQASAGATM